MRELLDRYLGAGWIHLAADPETWAAVDEIPDRELWAGREPGLPFSTPEEAVTLASIVEKETGVAAERPRVAGVFINRLKAGMALQSDPTIIYGISKGLANIGATIFGTPLPETVGWQK